MLKILIFIGLMMIGCESYNPDGSINTSKSIDYSTITIDSCEYIDGYNRLAHKGNCKYCKKRRAEELKQIVEQLKK